MKYWPKTYRNQVILMASNGVACPRHAQRRLCCAASEYRLAEEASELRILKSFDFA